jgi:hypothetical protein
MRKARGILLLLSACIRCPLPCTLNLVFLPASFLCLRHYAPRSIHQSDEGIVFGSWMAISLSQQVSVPSPGFVLKASVPQTSQRYLFPSLLGIGRLLIF